MDPMAEVWSEEGDPCPRDIVLHLIIMRELYEDETAREFISGTICSDWLKDRGLRLADGEQWNIEWHEVSEMEARLNDSATGIIGSLVAGDYRFRARAKVMKLDGA